jgi:hypothetical protein
MINLQPQATGNVLKDGIAYAPLAYYTMDHEERILARFGEKTE